MAGCAFVGIAQQRVHLSLSNSCRHDDQPIDVDTYTWEAETDAVDIVRRICDAMSIDNSRIVIKVGNVPNALAYIAPDGSRQIIYNANYLRKMQENTGDYWAGIGIIAHEIGHHINFDPFYEDGSRPEIELKADEFAGFALARMGAAEQQALACTSAFSKNGSATHPGKSAREAAILRGWRKGGSGGGGAADSDGDGIPDLQDACPTEYGFVKTRGCPDTDDDGIPNRNDDCPFEPGTLERRGCPEPIIEDTDGDGIPDVSDKCPTIKGTAVRFEGCPDTDGDNIPDHLDRCPNHKGLPARDGCPDETRPASPTTATTTTPIAAIAANMVQVPGGTFTMGCQGGRDTDCFDDEKPAHQVTLTTYYISKYEVTQAQWRAVMGEDPAELYNKGCDLCPVERVSWNDVQEFLRRLNAQTGQNYRLPTEAEWEYAARGGAGSRGYLYSGSNDLNEVAWYRANAKDGNTHGSEKTTRPVGGKKANELGLYDMSGNVWEWCSDWYGAYTAGAQTNPKGASSGADRVGRGGSWRNHPQYCRAADRSGNTPTDRGYDLGFRLARS